VELVAEADAVERLAERIERGGRLGLLKLTPTHLRVLGERLEGRADGGGAECLVVGGEALLGEQLEFWRRRFPATVLVNEYGPTETVVGCCTHARTLEETRGGPVPIGRPAPGVALYVLDPSGRLVPEGVPGELYIGGAQAARGYLGRPGLTAERFVPDPLSPRPGARLYRTGDRARWRGDGTLEYLGRLDAQVKVRGFRVEPGEIEAVLLRHAGVDDCAVVVREDRPGDPRLVAYVAGAADADALRAHLRRSLPEHMVPGVFVAMEALPFTANGKLDRRALPAPAAARPEDAFVGPRDALELRLARLWEELLDMRPVGVRDDFFRLGGHSLLALRLLAGVEWMTGTRLAMATLLAQPTVERLARALRGEAALPAAGPLVPLQPAGERRPLFLAHAAGGHVVSYAALARHLGPGQPVYALQSRGLEEGETAPHARIADMAADYLAQLRAVQPEGPYRLGGWSMGGLVAFEMARLLAAAGEAVELLALVDSRVPRDDAPALDPGDPRLLVGFGLHLGLDPARIPFTADAAAALAPGEGLRRAWEAARSASLVPDDLDLSRFERLWSVFRANAAAASAYRPAPCASDLLVLFAGDRAGAAADAERWKALTTGSVRAAAVPGDHFTLVREPHVGRLAALLADALAAG
jgi:thioesterase domain-containing protein